VLVNLAIPRTRHSDGSFRSPESYRLHALRLDIQSAATPIPHKITRQVPCHASTIKPQPNPRSEPTSFTRLSWRAKPHHRQGDSPSQNLAGRKPLWTAGAELPARRRPRGVAGAVLRGTCALAHEEIISPPPPGGPRCRPDRGFVPIDGLAKDKEIAPGQAAATARRQDSLWVNHASGTLNESLRGCHFLPDSLASSRPRLDQVPQRQSSPR
jgi:hypothetical protein